MQTSVNLVFTLVSCFGLMALVAVIAYVRTRGTIATRDGYFLAGRGLTGMFIAGSLLLTNLSAEQLIGLNGSAYAFNMASMAWEVTAGFAILLMALVFLPRYLAGAFTTLPQFLSERFDDTVRRWTVVLFLFGYGLITIPSILYSGSIAIMQIFDVPALLGIDYGTSLVVVVLAVGLIGAAYAIFGGLRAVAVSDTINGLGLLIIGAIVPLFGLAYLGEGSIARGLNTVLTQHTEKLNAIGAPSDATPVATLFTGMIFANLFYWCTNQYVIQRTLAAKSLAEGQRGVLISGFFKLMVPFLMMLPGVIAYHLYGSDLETMDMAYPRLVSDVLPAYLSGFFLAVLLGAVLSSFNSLLNSAATLFTLDIYIPLVGRDASDQKLISVAKKASLLIAGFSFLAAPLLQFAPQGLWQVIRIFTGYYNIPIITIVLVGLFTRRVPSSAAKTVIVFHIISYTALKFVWPVDLHFVHLYGILFVVELGIMLIIGWYSPQTPRPFVARPQVDMTPWRFALPVSAILVGCIFGLYVVFSPVGLAGGASRGMGGWMVVVAAASIALAAWGWQTRSRYAQAVRRRFG